MITVYIRYKPDGGLYYLMNQYTIGKQLLNDLVTAHVSPYVIIFETACVFLQVRYLLIDMVAFFDGDKQLLFYCNDKGDHDYTPQQFAQYFNIKISEDTIF